MYNLITASQWQRLCLYLLTRERLLMPTVVHILCNPLPSPSPPHLSSQVLDAPSAICRYLDDNSCSALIILGFVMMSPLVMVAAAVFCGLLRRFRLLLLIQPLTRAWYRGRLLDWVGGDHAWVWAGQIRRVPRAWRVPSISNKSGVQEENLITGTQQQWRR